MFFRQLNIPTAIVDEVRANVLKAYDENKYLLAQQVVRMNSIHYPQSLKKWFNERGFFPFQALIFVNYSGISSQIHVDFNKTTYPTDDTYVRPTRHDRRLDITRVATEVPHENVINIGIKNYIKTPVTIYDCGKDWWEDLRTSAGLDRPRLVPPDLSKAQPIDSYNLKHPVLLNTSTPHKINNTTDEVRISISYRFHEDPLTKLFPTDFL